MVLGGTADITVQKVERDGKLSQLHIATGGSWGGSCVNNAFFQDLTSTFGKQVFQEFMKTNPEDYFHLRDQFEMVKRKIGTDQEFVFLHLPSSFKKTVKKFNGKRIKDILNEVDAQQKVFNRDGKLNYSTDYFKTFFTFSIQSVLDQLRKVLKSKKCSEVEYILMVGGFSESEFVRSSISEALPHVRVINPEDAALSVLKGGVLFGHDPNTVRFRVCPQTYGIAMHDYFNPKIHDLTKSCKVGNTQFIVGCFEKIFEKDEVLEVGQKKTIRVTEDFSTQPENVRTENKEIEMYSSVEKDPKYITDAVCTLQGIIVVAPPAGRWPEKMKGKITFEVTVTGIKVSFEDRETKTISGGEVKFTEPKPQTEATVLNRSFRKD